MKYKVTAGAIIVALVYFSFPGLVSAELRLPWDYGVEKEAHRIDTRNVKDVSNNPYNGNCSTHASPNIVGKIDFKLATGENIRSSEDGTVVDSVDECPGGMCTGWGKYVTVMHSENSYSLYAHMSSVGVETGNDVTQGALLGEVGETGNASGPHIHYEWWTCNGIGCRTNPSFFEGTEQVFPNPAGRLVCGFYTSKNSPDDQRPNITINTPTPNSKKGRSFSIDVDVEDVGVAQLDRVEFEIFDNLNGTDYSQYLSLTEKIYENPQQSDSLAVQFSAPNSFIQLRDLKVRVKAYDRYGNWRSWGVVFSVDGQDPVLDLSNFPDEYQQNDTFSFNWSGTDNVTPDNNIRYWYQITGPAPTISSNYYGPGLAVEPFMPEGVYLINFYAADEHNNVVSQSIVSTIDNTPPSAPETAVSTCGAASGIWQNSCLSSGFEWQDGDDGVQGSGIKDYLVYFGSDPQGTSTSQIAGNNMSEQSVSASGAYYLRVKPIDRAGNEGVWSTIFEFFLDLNPPVFEFDLDRGGAVSTDSTINLRIFSEDSESGNDSYRYKTNGGQWSQWGDYDSTPSVLDVIVPFIKRSTHIVKVQMQDKLGNLASPQEATIRITGDDSIIGSSDIKLRGTVVSHSTGQQGVNQRLYGEINSFGNESDPSAVSASRFASSLLPQPSLPEEMQLMGGIAVAGSGDKFRFSLSTTGQLQKSSASYSLTGEDIIHSVSYANKQDRLMGSFKGVATDHAEGAVNLNGAVQPFTKHEFSL